MILYNHHHNKTPQDSNHTRSAQLSGNLVIDGSSQTDCYVLIAVLFVKVLFYTLVIPSIFSTPSHFIAVPISFFVGILYVDHIYLVPPLPQIAIYDAINTTVISTDVLGASLLLVLLDTIQPESEDCWEPLAVLLTWGVMSVGYSLLLTSKNSSMKISNVHSSSAVRVIAFIMFLSFVLVRSLSECEQLQVTNDHSDTMNKTNQVSRDVLFSSKDYVRAVHFYLRNILYCFIILIDTYVMRHDNMAQKENERIFFCKYGILLFISWPIAIVLFCCFCCIIVSRNMDCDTFLSTSPVNSMDIWNPNRSQEITLDNNNNINNHNDAIPMLPTPSSATMDLDVLEAFKMAKQQYNLHHGGKTN